MPLEAIRAQATKQGLGRQGKAARQRTRNPRFEAVCVEADVLRKRATTGKRREEKKGWKGTDKDTCLHPIDMTGTSTSALWVASQAMYDVLWSDYYGRYPLVG